MTRFIHSSDLHIAKPFGRFEPDLRARLREARHAKIPALAAIARENGAGVVLLAGDTFDAETPAGSVLRQTIRAFAHESDIHWVLLPGNHDSLAADELWSRFRCECPANVTLALTPEPVEIGADLAILPAPLPVRHPGRDLTDWMDDAPTGDRIRVGLAHGPIQDFSSDEPQAALITPDRARRARLDYLALGDWHGQIAVSSACYYSGTPEPASFKLHAPAGVLVIDIAARGAQPTATPVETAAFHWTSLQLDVRPGDAPEAQLAQALPPTAARRNTLLSLTATGYLTLAEQARLSAAISEIAEDFGYFEADLYPLGLEHEAADLDDIARDGALRETAQALLARSEDATREESARQVSKTALARLYAYAQTAAS